MIEPSVFLSWLTQSGISHFAGVPDSLLKPLSLAIDSHEDVHSHVISANEGAAIGFGVGVYLESARPAVIYMQNSGLGNAVNPLTALAHRQVYGTPLVLIIGWRGEPGKPDEPQHMVQGKITPNLLEVLGVPFVVLDKDEDISRKRVTRVLKSLQVSPGPVAVIVPKGVFLDGNDESSEPSSLSMTREEALEAALESIPDGDRVVATTGMLGRELCEIRTKKSQTTANDFLVVGGMGHASSIAHGVATADSSKNVWCLDGDGSLIMHLGSLAVIANTKPTNLKHIVFNNYAHDSVGGQPTAAKTIDLEGLCGSIGYSWGGSTSSYSEISSLVSEVSNQNGPVLLELRIRKGARPDLGRPPTGFFAQGFNFLRGLG